MTLDETHEVTVEEENYFVSMTDMMVGLVFIFIILLMFYVLQFRDVTDKLTSADVTRTQILKELQATLKSKGVPVTIDTQNGILRLPEALLFGSGQPNLNPAGRGAVAHLADALADVLPCYTDLGPRPQDCPGDRSHRIESVYVEGHTDRDNFYGGAGLRDNWDLSVARATNTYRTLTEVRPELGEICSLKADGDCGPILSVSGYEARRPACSGETPEAKACNRRIDLRIIMMTPDDGATAAAVQKRLIGK